ncbi:MAG: hypothetical protein AB1776_08525 [Bacillota bacterium]
MAVSKITPIPKQPKDPFAGIRPGDRVAVSWPDKLAKPYDGYGRGGAVVQVTPNLLAVRCPAGYVFCVRRSDTLSGVRVRKVGGTG